MGSERMWVDDSMAATSMHVTGITVVRNELDVVEASIRHALRVLCDRVLVLDNASTDGTWQKLLGMARELPIDAISNDGPFDQSAMMTGLLHEASSAGSGWIVPFDADEFWWSPGSRPREALTAVPNHVGVLACPVVNYVSHRHERESRDTSLRRMRYRAAGAWATRADVINGVAGFVELHYPPKVVMRASRSAVIQPGQHSVHDHDREGRSGKWLSCLHAPLRSLAQLKRRATLVDRHIESAESCVGGAWQFQHWYELDRRDELEEEWVRNSHLHGKLGRWDAARLVPDPTLVRLVRRALPSRTRMTF